MDPFFMLNKCYLIKVKIILKTKKTRKLQIKLKRKMKKQAL